MTNIFPDGLKHQLDWMLGKGLGLGVSESPMFPAGQAAGSKTLRSCQPLKMGEVKAVLGVKMVSRNLHHGVGWTLRLQWVETTD